MKNHNLAKPRKTLQRSVRCCLLVLFLPILLLKVTNCRVVAATVTASRGDEKSGVLDSDPSNVHAIIVSSSRYWFNYRHAINALGMYEIYRQNGVPDENIILSTYTFICVLYCICSVWLIGGCITIFVCSKLGSLHWTFPIVSWVSSFYQSIYF